MEVKKESNTDYIFVKNLGFTYYIIKLDRKQQTNWKFYI